MDFGTKLKEARARLGLRQEDIADGIDVSRQTVSNWENNRSLPDLRSIVEISDIYQISLDDLLKGDRKVMEKLIKDSDIKTMENKLNILTLIVLVTSSLPGLTRQSIHFHETLRLMDGRVKPGHEVEFRTSARSCRSGWRLSSAPVLRRLR